MQNSFSNMLSVLRKHRYILLKFIETILCCHIDKKKTNASLEIHFHIGVQKYIFYIRGGLILGHVTVLHYHHKFADGALDPIKSELPLMGLIFKAFQSASIIGNVALTLIWSTLYFCYNSANGAQGLFCVCAQPTRNDVTVYYSTGVQIVSCTLSDDSVLSESTGVGGPAVPRSRSTHHRCTLGTADPATVRRGSNPRIIGDHPGAGVPTRWK